MRKKETIIIIIDYTHTTVMRKVSLFAAAAPSLLFRLLACSSLPIDLHIDLRVEVSVSIDFEHTSCVNSFLLHLISTDCFLSVHDLLCDVSEYISNTCS